LKSFEKFLIFFYLNKFSNKSLRSNSFWNFIILKACIRALKSANHIIDCAQNFRALLRWYSLWTLFFWINEIFLILEWKSERDKKAQRCIESWREMKRKNFLMDIFFILLFLTFFSPPTLQNTTSSLLNQIHFFFFFPFNFFFLVSCKSFQLHFCVRERDWLIYSWARNFSFSWASPHTFLSLI
jgi:hypothetical protein